MATFTAPTTGIAGISWKLPRHPTFAVKSGWTGKTQVVDIGATTGFAAEVTLAPKTRAQWLVWNAFFAQLKGLTNDFLLKPAPNIYFGGSTPLINGAGQTGAAINGTK